MASQGLASCKMFRQRLGDQQRLGGRLLSTAVLKASGLAPGAVSALHSLLHGASVVCNPTCVVCRSELGFAVKAALYGAICELNGVQ